MKSWEKQVLRDANTLLERITGQSQGEAGADEFLESTSQQHLTHSFIDASTTTTNKHMSLDNCIEILESKLNRFLDTASSRYVSVLQRG